ncbi:MAG TPA: L-lactate permease [Patescibacteria group bacterium]|nr:L-lactate permease [Patescibacteria group bacterium]
MNISLLVILSLTPFFLFLILLLWKRTSLFWVSLITLVLFLILSLIFWKTYPVYIVGSLTKGFLVALDIFFIIFGAIFFLEVLKSLNIIQNICFYLESLSKDHRIQVIILAWLFENFLEGTAGFGTPSTVVAPLLVGIGLTPISAVIIALLGNSASTVFGAAGTPIRVGYSDLATPSLPLFAARYNIIGLLVPVFILWILVAKEKNSKKQFLEGLPFAVWTGIAFVIPSLLTVFLGQEFPSIIGAVIAILLVLITTKLKIFIPKNVEDPHPIKPPEKLLPLTKIIIPYAVLIILLVLGKFFLAPISISVPLIIKHSISFFNPGFAFILVGIPVAIFFSKAENILFTTLKIAMRRTIEPFLVIVFMSGVAQLMINSGHNFSQFPSMLGVIALGFKNAFLPLWAPIIGAFGSFITGSATISNLMFGNFLALAAKEVGLNVGKILALALVGAAAGNMIALADIIATEAVVGLKNEERKILKGVIIPCLVYVLIVGLVGLLTI